MSRFSFLPVLVSCAALVRCTPKPTANTPTPVALSLVTLERAVLTVDQTTRLVFRASRDTGYALVVASLDGVGVTKVLLRARAGGGEDVTSTLAASDLFAGANTVTIFATTDDAQVAPLTLTLTVKGGITGGTGSTGPSGATGGTGVSGANTFSVGGQVTALFGQGLVLQLASPGLMTQTLPVSTPAFTFATALPDGASYTVSVSTGALTEPTQTCTLSAGATGTITGANVSSVAVTCGARLLSETPRAFFTDLVSAPKTAYVAVYGLGFGNTSETAPTVAVGTVEVPAFRFFPAGAPARGLDVIVFQLTQAMATGAEPVIVKRWGRSPANALTLTVRSNGNTYFVAPAASGGSDGNAGSEAAPFATPSKLLSVAQKGDVAYFRAGTYNTPTTFIGCDTGAGNDASIVCSKGIPGTGNDGLALVGYWETNPTASVARFSASGAGPKQIALLAQPGSVVANLHFGTNTASGPVVGISAQLRMNDCDGARVVGNTFEAQPAVPAVPQLLLLTNAVGASVLGNNFQGTGNADNLRINDPSTVGTISNTDVGYNQLNAAPQFGGVTLYGGATVTGVRIHHNRFGLHYKSVWLQDCGDTTSCSGGAGAQTSADQIDVYNNTFRSPTGQPYFENIYFSVRAGHFRFAHNSLDNPNSDGGPTIKLDNTLTLPAGAAAAAVCVDSNLIVSGEVFVNVLHTLTPSPQQHVNALSFSHNLYAVHASQPLCEYDDNSATCTLTDPALRTPPTFLPGVPNAASDDFTLAPSSGAIDAANPSVCSGALTVSDDFLGFPRTQGTAPDIGAYEYTP